MDPKLVAEVKQRFARIMELDPGELDLEARLDDTYGVTSMSAMRLISDLEVELGMDIPEEEIAGLHTLKNVVELCQRHLASPA